MRIRICMYIFSLPFTGWQSHKRILNYVFNHVCIRASMHVLHHKINFLNTFFTRTSRSLKKSLNVDETNILTVFHSLVATDLFFCSCALFLMNSAGPFWQICLMVSQIWATCICTSESVGCSSVTFALRSGCTF